MKRIVLAFTLLIAAAAPAAPQDQVATEFNGAGWVNSPALSLDRLRGKIVLMYFYEET
jgi:hypothetical protein